MLGGQMRINVINEFWVVRRTWENSYAYALTPSGYNTVVAMNSESGPALGIGKRGSRLGPPISLFISRGLAQESFHIYHFKNIILLLEDQ